jgi:DNA-directed RNA polymerase subunit K/omega
MKSNLTKMDVDSDNEKDDASIASGASNQNEDTNMNDDEDAEGVNDDEDEENVPGELENNEDEENDEEIEDEPQEDIISDEEMDDIDDLDDDNDDEEKPLKKKVLKRVSAKPLSDNHSLLIDAMNIQDDEDSDDSMSIDNELQMNGIMADDEDYDDDDDDDDPETYFQKFDEEINANYLLDQHPNQFNKNYDEIETLSNIVRDVNNNIIDPLHKTIPYLTKYERTRVLGQRAKQINSGSKPYVQVPDNIMDGYIIAQMELVQKRIPFIIQRPVYGGASEYWKLKDLELLM